MMNIKQENQRLNRALAHHDTKEQANSLKQDLEQKRKENNFLKKEVKQLNFQNRQFQEEIKFLQEELDKKSN